MRQIFLTLLIPILIVISMARDAVAQQTLAPAGGPFHAVVSNAKAGSTIVLPRQPHELESYAASELQKYVKAITGATLPIINQPQQPADYGIWLGKTTAAEAADFTLLLEPLNTLVDHPGYYLDSSALAADIVRAVGSPHLKILYDVYHMQIMEGNVLATIERHVDLIGHFHSAGVPGRGELFDCELDYRTIVGRIESLGYRGSFGLEYFPKTPDHLESLKRNLACLRDDPHRRE